MRELILFFMTFVVVFLIYQLFIVRKYKKIKNKKQLPEISYLVNKYHIDLNKINYNKLLNIVSIVSSFDIALLVSVSLLTESIFMEMVIALVLAVPTIIISYSFIGRYYKKKGMIKNV